MRFLSTQIRFAKILLSGAFMTGVLFVSCTDNDILSSKDKSRLISFEVSETGNNLNGDHTRSETLSVNKIVKLNGGERDLYLVPTVEDNYISKSSSLTTRGTAVNTDNMVSFGVYAGYASENGMTSYNPDYMSNVEVTRAADWIPNEEYLWPGAGALHFNAYSPFYSGDTSQGVSGINVDGGQLRLYYSVPDSVIKQPDLLFATPLNASSSPCTLSFNHALTAIRFVAGAEMAPCVVKSISISNLFSEGILNLETGEWSDLSAQKDYIVKPDIILEKGVNSDYVEAGTEITSPEKTFMMLPQILGEETEISIVVESNGKETTLTSSLDGTIWPQGKTLTYRISANPDADSLILNVSGDFKTIYTGSSFSFNVESYLNSTEGKQPVSWIAEFVDNNGNPIERPNWIEEMTQSGEGDLTGEGKTVMQDLIFENMTAQTHTLQVTPDVNVSSGFTPYNLSSSTGSSSIENTANTYIINAPGTYSLPLVYGNAIKDGGENKGAYTSSSHNRNALKVFVNHLNNAITSPYIYENASCTPADAVLVWEDELNLVRNVRLSSDKKSLIFDIPQNTIRQGNAMIAVRDENKAVMWSWQLWVTDYTLSTGSRTVSVSGKNYELSTENLGYIAGGDITRFPECKVKIRFTQTGLPEGVEPLSKTVELVQSEALITTPDCNTFYQWGRKDPMMSSVKQWYNAEHQEITELPVTSAETMESSSIVENFILHPETFFTGSHDLTQPTSYPYNNLWNISYNTANTKGIYDPSPVGFVVPYSEPFHSMVQNTSLYTLNYLSSSTDTQKEGFYLTLSTGGEPLFFPDFAYRAGSTGILASGPFACYWTSHAVNLINGGCFEFENSDTRTTFNQLTDPLYHAMSLRPIKE